jgi:hypothetical protein
MPPGSVSGGAVDLVMAFREGARSRYEQNAQLLDPIRLKTSQILADLQKEYEFSVLDPRVVLCEKQKGCLTVNHNKAFYEDKFHLSAFGAESAAILFLKAINDRLSSPTNETLPGRFPASK